MPFETERKTLESGVVMLALKGTMTMGNQLQQLEWAVRDMTKNNQNKIVVDLSGVTYIDSAAMGVLIACYGSAQRAGGQLRLAGVQDRVLSALQLVNLDKVLAFDTTTDDSVSALAAGA